MDYPKINREDVDFSNTTEICNIGYKEGIFNEDLPYRIEVWSTSGIITASVFVSDSANLTEKELKILLQNDNIIDFINDRSEANTIIDSNENSFMVLNIPIENNGEDENILKISLDDYDL